jgi:hypothetical protein
MPEFFAPFANISKVIISYNFFSIKKPLSTESGFLGI